MPGLHPVEVSRYNYSLDVYVRINMSLSCLQEYFGLMTGQKQKHRLGISMEVHMCIEYACIHDSTYSCTVLLVWMHTKKYSVMHTAIYTIL